MATELASFPHGIHPPTCKDDTCDLPIRQFPFAPVMAIPLSQHQGKPARAIVREGEQVLRGQRIADADGFNSVAMHAPATGRIQRIALMPGVSGQMSPGIYLVPDPGSTQEVCQGVPCELEKASAEEIILAIQQAGIVGLGGAAFPTHAKLKIPAGMKVDTLLLNGAECEPYLTTDHRVMLEQTEDIFIGIRYLLKACGAERAVIGIEANKQDAADRLLALLPGDLPVSIELCSVKYPQGAEKMLVKSLLHRDIPAGGLPRDIGVVVINVATAAEIGHLLPRGQGIQERVITISGPAIKKKGNYQIPIGTPLRFALEYAELDPDVSQVFLGGPMMGTALTSLDIPITKGTSGFIAFTRQQTGAIQQPEYPCINCGYCVSACPVFLNPARLGALARTADYQSMADNYHLLDCFECGACAYVCPAHIPLVQRFRSAKSMLRKQAEAPSETPGEVL
jgi:electron transport complex protein RnfC